MIFSVSEKNGYFYGGLLMNYDGFVYGFEMGGGGLMLLEFLFI